MGNNKNTKNNNTPRLCGGTFCDLLMQIKTKSIPDTMKGLIKLLSPEFVISDTSLSTDASEYINCSKSNTSNIPFNKDQNIKNQQLINEFDEKIKNSDATLLSNFNNFVRDYLDKKHLIWLIKALCELIESDNSITDNDKFYIYYDSNSITKKELTKTREIYTEAFILGIFDFVLTQRPNNKIGQETYDSWHKKQTKPGTRRDFISKIGLNKKEYKLTETIINDKKTINNNVEIEVVDKTPINEDHQEHSNRQIINYGKYIENIENYYEGNDNE